MPQGQVRGCEWQCLMIDIAAYTAASLHSKFRVEHVPRQKCGCGHQISNTSLIRRGVPSIVRFRFELGFLSPLYTQILIHHVGTDAASEPRNS